MNKTVKNALILGAIGFAGGMLVCFMFTLFNLDEVKQEFELIPFLRYYLMGSLNGAICMGATVVYNIERWSILRATATHFVITFISLFTFAFVTGWFKLGDPSFYITVIVCLVVYVIIWLTQYFIFKRKVKRINKELERVRDENSTK